MLLPDNLVPRAPAGRVRENPVDKVAQAVIRHFHISHNAPYLPSKFLVQVSPNWSQETMTCHSSNCFSIVCGQGNASWVASLPSSCYITQNFAILYVISPGYQSQEKLKTMLMQNFGGQMRCIVGNAEVAYRADVMSKEDNGWDTFMLLSTYQLFYG